MAYRFGQYTQPLMLQRQLGQAATTGSLLEDLRTRNLRKTKSEYQDIVENKLRAAEEAAARKAEGIGKKFGILKTVANFIPGGQFLKPVLAGIEAKESGKAFSKSAKGLGKYKGTFMGDTTEAFAEGQKNLAKSFDPFKSFASSMIEGLVTSRAKHSVPGEDKLVSSEFPGPYAAVPETNIPSEMKEWTNAKDFLLNPDATATIERFPGPLQEGAYTDFGGLDTIVPGGPVEKMWKDMSPKERLGSIFPGGGVDEKDILTQLTRATTAFSPYLNRPKYTTSFYGG